MKKFFWIVFILLFLGAGYVYLVKNPDLPLSQTILTTLGVTKTAPQGTGIDLTNCINYFDGCNNCSVKDGKVDACTLMYCETPTAPKCNLYATGKTTQSDLDTCTRYYDGCNTCEVTNGKITGCTKMHCTTMGQATCLEHTTDNDNGPKQSITDFQSCMDAGNPIMESYPRQCSANGKTYREAIDNEQTVCTMEYAPVCASVQVQCIKAPCNPIEKTFGNRCMMKANKSATYLHDGECAAADCPQRSQPSPSFCTDGIVVDGGKDANGCQQPPKCQKK